MERHPDIDDITAERLLSGRVGPDDAPDSLRGVAALLAAAGHADAAPADAALVAAMADVITASPAAANDAGGRRPVLGRLLTAKAAAVFGVVALSTSGAAAATGRLPAVAQDRLAQAVSHVGIHLPTSADDDAGDDDGGAEAGTGEQHGNSADTHGAEVSDTARTTEATGREKGEAVSTVARDGHGESAPDRPAADDHPTGPPEGRAPEKPAPAPTTTPTTAAPQAPAGSTPAESRPTTDDRPRGRP